MTQTETAPIQSPCPSSTPLSRISHLIKLTPPIIVASLIISAAIFGSVFYSVQNRPSPSTLPGRYMPIAHGEGVFIIDTANGGIYTPMGQDWETTRWLKVRDALNSAYTDMRVWTEPKRD